MPSEDRLNHVIDVLLVEDDEAHARLIQRAFESSQISVDVRHAIDIKGMRHELNRKLPQFLIVDYLLPDGRSLDAIARETRLGFVPTVLITSFPDDQVVFEARKAGVHRLVPKSQAGFSILPQIVGSEFLSPTSDALQ